METHTERDTAIYIAGYRDAMRAVQNFIDAGADVADVAAYVRAIARGPRDEMPS